MSNVTPEQAEQLTNQLIEKNKTARKLLGNKYAEYASDYAVIILAVMDKHGLDSPLEAIEIIAKTPSFKENKVARLLFFSASFDLLLLEEEELSQLLKSA